MTSSGAVQGMPWVAGYHNRVSMLVLCLVSVLVFGGWWLLLPRSLGRLARAVYAGLLGAAQIVGTQLLLGALGQLRLPLLVAAVLVVTLPVLIAGVRRRRGVPAPPRESGLATVLGIDAVNATLFALLLFVTVWLLVATWLLPPRGVDDVVYHLPPLYDLVQTGRLAVLPLQIRVQFALPLGGDFLYLWPLLFLHADTWVDGVQFVVALFGVLVVAALAGRLGAERRDALFAGLLWLFVPVVLAQSASNYVEIILAVCQLVLLYAAVRVWQTGQQPGQQPGKHSGQQSEQWLHLAMAGLAAGFGLGVKYSMLISIVAVLPILVLPLWRDGGLGRTLRGAGIFLLTFAPLPAYWLVRNALLTGYPLYPYALTATGLQDMGGGDPQSALPGVLAGGEVGAGSALSALLNEPARFLLYLFEDPGLGSLNGGFGLIFWGFGLPALAFSLARAVRRRDWLAALVFVQVLPVVLIFLLQTDLSRVRFNLRLILLVVALGLVALALLLRELRDEAPWTATALRATGVLASLLAVVHLASVTLPPLQIGEAVADRSRGTDTSPFIYYRQSDPVMAQLAPAFAAVDYLTRDSGGWQVALAAEWRVFNTSPLFGTRLQNRVWNFQAQPPAPPDALIFQQPAPGAELFYPWPDQRLTPVAMRRDDRYALVALPGEVELWILKSRLATPEMEGRLTEFLARLAGSGS